MKLFSKWLKNKKKKSRNSNMKNPDNGNGEMKTVSVKAIMEEYNLVPRPFDIEGEMREWFDSFVEVKESELAHMNVDLDNFDIYEAEIDAHIRDAINTLEIQLINHKRMLQDVREVIRGKNVEYRSDEEGWNQDLENANRRLEELNKMKKAYGGV